MRNLLVALFVVGLVVAPSFGVIKVALNANGSSFDGTNNVYVAAPGETVTVSVYGGADTTGIAAICGATRALTGGTAGMLTTVANSWTWGPQWPGYVHQDGVDEFGDPVYDLYFPNLTGTAVTGGGYGSTSGTTNLMGSVRLDPALPNQVGILPSTVLVATYQVTVSPTALAGDSVTLAWANKTGAPFAYGTASSAEGVVAPLTTGLTITVPEPATMALLALGGLLVARRRRA